MKRVLCPRCDGYVAFDERRCCAGESLFLVCSHCGKSFSLSYEEIIRQPDTTDCGTLVVLENNCCERQEFPFVLGDNVIGRRNKGTECGYCYREQRCRSRTPALYHPCPPE